MPRLRFPGFEGEWEERRIGELLTIHHGRDYKHLPKGNVPVLGTGGIIAYVDTALCNWPCALIGRKGSIDKPQYMDVPFWSVDTLFYTKASAGQNPKWQYYLFHRVPWRKYDDSTGVPSLSASVISSICAFVPTKREQDTIVEFLSILDARIVAQRKLVELLKKLKRGLSNGLFTSSLQELPQLRFPGFKSRWECRSFSEVFSFLKNNTFSRSQMTTEGGTIRNVHYGDVLIKFDEVLDCDRNQIPFLTDGDPPDTSRSLQDGDVIFADTAEDEAVGKAVELTGVGDKLIESGLHTIACRPRMPFASRFLGYYLNSTSYRQQLLPLMQGIKVLSLSKSQIGKTILIFPSDISEQHKIVEMLSGVDAKIAVTKSSLERMQLLKSGLLQQMFA